MDGIVDTGAAIKWYRTPLPRETLAALNRRSDLRGLLQSFAVLVVLGATGSATLCAAFSGYWLMVPLLLFLHGTVGSFHINAVHELCHNSVFKTKVLNSLFVRIFGFLGWIDWVWFSTSHANHHRYTLHPPRDGEVVLPLSWICRANFWKAAIVQPLTPFRVTLATLRRARGLWSDDWTKQLFPEDKPLKKRRLMRWNRALLVGHGVILVGAIAAAALAQRWAWLLVPYVVSFSSTYGSWLHWACNQTQHVGLTDKVPDFRMCCRSMKLPRIVSFLYWHMEHHVEHHMHAAVPCYSLHKLSRAIAHDVPEPKGLVASWREINAIQKRQRSAPGYQFAPSLPGTATPVLHA